MAVQLRLQSCSSRPHWPPQPQAWPHLSQIRISQKDLRLWDLRRRLKRLLSRAQQQLKEAEAQKEAGEAEAAERAAAKRAAEEAKAQKEAEGGCCPKSSRRSKG